MSFCTVINCMDGRVQIPVNEFLKRRFGVEYVDTITEAGPNGILAQGTDAARVESILERLRISIEGHGSVGVAVVGHHDCAGNPTPPEQQERDTRAAVEFLKSRCDGLPVAGLWVDQNWVVSELTDTVQRV